MGGAVKEGIETAYGAYNFYQDRKSAKKELKNIEVEHGLKQRQMLNVLEKDLASRRARLGGQGIGNSNSFDALQKRTANEAYLNIVQDDISKKSQKDSIKKTYRKNRDQFVYDNSTKAMGYTKLLS